MIYPKTTGPLMASGYNKLGTQEAMSNMFVVERNDMNVYRKGAHPQKMELAQTWEEAIVRRLTPRECEALQGFPCGWTDIGEWTDTKGKVHQTTDSARYKALGNSIAVGFANEQRGFWMWLIKRISAQFERSATMGSLFDGISGFPLAWATYNGPKNCLWSSEIEEFCIAVCKRHFGDEETGEEGDIYEYLKEYMG